MPVHNSLNGRRFAFVANSDFFLPHFHLRLMRNLVASGAAVTAVAPGSNDQAVWETEGIGSAVYRIRRGSLNPMAARRAIADLRRIFKDTRPDIVHSFTVASSAYASAAAQLAGVEHLVVTVSGLGSMLAGRPDGLRDALRRLAVREATRWGCQRADRVTFENRNDLDFFVERHLADVDRAALIPGGVDTDFYAPGAGNSARSRKVRASWGLDEQATVVTMVGRLLRDKGVREFVAASRLVRRSAPQVEFVLIGAPDKGNPESMTESELDHIHRTSRVRMGGFRTDIRDCLVASDVFVLPSYAEGHPRSSLEAMSCGLPVVTTDVQGCRDTVEHGVNGFLVPARDAQALADAVARLATSPELRLSMGRQSRRLARRSFSVGRAVERYRRLYESLLAGGLAMRANRAVPGGSTDAR
jgi:glycosyltransferase involved in cell wall biosynthesis